MPTEGSGGFSEVAKRLLDLISYKKGRKITLAGEFIESRKGKIYDMELAIRCLKSNKFISGMNRPYTLSHIITLIASAILSHTIHGEGLTQVIYGRLICVRWFSFSKITDVRRSRIFIFYVERQAYFGNRNPLGMVHERVNKGSITLSG